MVASLPPSLKRLSDEETQYLRWYRQREPWFCGGHQVTLLRGGDALFPAQVQAIAGAQRSVWFGTYIFHNDAAGRVLIDALREAAQRGVAVRVVVDGFGSRENLAWMRSTLASSGVELHVFRPIERWWQWLRSSQLRRLHQKLCTVDGEVAFVGGINVIDDRIDQFHGPLTEPRLDFAVAVRGPLVATIEQTLRAIWTRAGLGEEVKSELEGWLRGEPTWPRTKAFLREIRMPDEPPPVDLETPMCAAFVLRDNLRQRHTIENAYIAAIREARTSIDLISPYFYPGKRFRRALIGAARRGVRVRLLLQGQVDYRIAALAAQALYDALLAAGVEIHEYTAAFLHAKVCAIDGMWATVGSSNIDPLSLVLNLEANVIVRDRAFAQQLQSEFETALQGSRRITVTPLKGWRHALGRRVVAWGARAYLRIAGATGKY